MKLLGIDQNNNVKEGENNMGAAVTVIILILIIALLVVPIIPSESCSDTTKTAEILGYRVASRTDTVCSQSSTSILSIFMKGLKSP